MGLDASVYCDCYERGRLNSAAPQPELVYVDANGQLSLKWEEPGADQDLFYDWLKQACEHAPRGELISHRLGNIACIGVLRKLLSRTSELYPVLLTKVIYDGTHCGDYLGLDDVARLASEISALGCMHCPDQSEEDILRQFEQQMTELVSAATRVRKPIAF